MAGLVWPRKTMAGSASNRAQLEYAVGGVPVKFPCKPYPTQMAMMAKVPTSPIFFFKLDLQHHWWFDVEPDTEIAARGGHSISTTTTAATTQLDPIY